MNDRQFSMFGGDGDSVRETPPPPSGDRPELFLIDGMALLYRAYFALLRAGMKTRDGQPTGALFGFLSTLLRIYETYHPRYLAAAFDSREKTFRHDLFGEYKANREAPPEEMTGQIEPLFELLRALRIPILRTPGYEADDLIGTAARQFEKECSIYIVSPDKDLAQLVHDGVRLLRPTKNQNELQLMGPEEVREQFGVPPEQFTQFLTLTGDTSDNIPGAQGIGPKTAASLLLRFGSIEEAYRHIGELTPKARKSLEEFRPRLELITDLVTIRTDLELEVTLDELACTTPERRELLELLGRLELKTIASRLPLAFPEIGPLAGSEERGPTGETEGDDPQETLGDPRDGADYGMISTEEELGAFVSEMLKKEKIAVDTETTSLDTFKAELAGISISAEPHSARFISFAGTRLERTRSIEILRPLLENPAIAKTGQNLKYDILVLKSYGLELQPVAFDTMLASYVLDPDAKHNLDDLAAAHLRLRTTKYDELTGTGKNRLHIYDVEPGRLTDYACQDADVALQLEGVFEQSLEREPRLLELCRQIEFPLVRVLAAMEHRGISIDLKHLEETSTAVGSQLELLTEKIHAAAGTTFNIDSPKQLSNILFNVLGLPTKKTTKTGFSTNVEVLEELAPLHPIVGDLLDYRSLQKLKSTYIDALPKMVNPRTGKVHTSFNQHVTATGRLSSSNPNLQNIPIRTALGREIRKAFIPTEDRNLLLSADYSQIELRIAAEISKDPKLIEAFRNGEDIHLATARVIFDTEEITSDMRRKAKEVNFGVLYGIQPFGLSKRLNIPRNEAREIIDTYRQKYPGLFEALEQIVREGRENGFVTTLLGRRRYLGDLTSRNANVQKAAERAAMNTPIQGTAADIIKCAMNLCSERIETAGMRSQMLLQVHDELVFETPPEEKEALSSLVETAMTEAAAVCGLRNVPVTVDIGTGKNWLEAH
ncbi:DNA polymerase I [Chlorobium sp. N1]|uniref:DNA polymerase I n=1 Tax=Chlorobium sp. N1 TaxID=2491138 RepID=UPI001038BBB4|nr:DNA polymerase I [Chlorobium sp. N1]TCD48770.1 DNA polymerase I [Chlorobium sp. N1]